MDLILVLLVIIGLIALVGGWFKYGEQILNKLGIDTDDMIHFSDDSRK